MQYVGPYWNWFESWFSCSVACCAKVLPGQGVFCPVGAQAFAKVDRCTRVAHTNAHSAVTSAHTHAHTHAHRHTQTHTDTHRHTHTHKHARIHDLVFELLRLVRYLVWYLVRTSCRTGFISPAYAAVCCSCYWCCCVSCVSCCCCCCWAAATAKSAVPCSPGKVFYAHWLLLWHPFRGRDSSAEVCHSWRCGNCSRQKSLRGYPDTSRHSQLQVAEAEEHGILMNCGQNEKTQVQAWKNIADKSAARVFRVLMDFASSSGRNICALHHSRLYDRFPFDSSCQAYMMESIRHHWALQSPQVRWRMVWCHATWFSHNFLLQ